jgi:hypothetical protein
VLPSPVMRRRLILCVPSLVRALQFEPAR